MGLKTFNASWNIIYHCLLINIYTRAWLSASAKTRAGVEKPQDGGELGSQNPQIDLDRVA